MGRFSLFREAIYFMLYSVKSKVELKYANMFTICRRRLVLLILKILIQKVTNIKTKRCLKKQKESDMIKITKAYISVFSAIHCLNSQHHFKDLMLFVL